MGYYSISNHELTASRFGASIDTENVMPESGEGSSRIEEEQCLDKLLLRKMRTNLRMDLKAVHLPGMQILTHLKENNKPSLYQGKRKNFTISNFSDNFDISDEWVYKPTTERILNDEDIKALF